MGGRVEGTVPARPLVAVDQSLLPLLLDWLLLLEGGPSWLDGAGGATGAGAADV